MRRAQKGCSTDEVNLAAQDGLARSLGSAGPTHFAAAGLTGRNTWNLIDHESHTLLPKDDTISPVMHRWWLYFQGKNTSALDWWCYWQPKKIIIPQRA